MKIYLNPIQWSVHIKRTRTSSKNKAEKLVVTLLPMSDNVDKLELEKGNTLEIVRELDLSFWSLLKAGIFGKELETDKNKTAENNKNKKHR